MSWLKDVSDNFGEEIKGLTGAIAGLLRGYHPDMKGDNLRYRAGRLGDLPEFFQQILAILNHKDIKEI